MVRRRDTRYVTNSHRVIVSACLSSPKTPISTKCKNYEIVDKLSSWRRVCCFRNILELLETDDNCWFDDGCINVINIMEALIKYWFQKASPSKIDWITIQVAYTKAHKHNFDYRLGRLVFPTDWENDLQKNFSGQFKASPPPVRASPLSTRAPSLIRPSVFVVGEKLSPKCFVTFSQLYRDVTRNIVSIQSLRSPPKIELGTGSKIRTRSWLFLSLGSDVRSNSIM